tara:strand:+ start:1362 stop:1760 length:399 start_codon:yes stop_codon:yes gene_type:complete
MTVFDASVKLYSWFSENDHFCLSDTKIVFGDSSVDTKASAKCALKKLEELGVIHYAQVESDEYWVLAKNMNDVNQDVSLDGQTCLSVSKIINTYREVLGVKEEKCDPSSIKSKDITNLVLICFHLLDNQDEQ